MATAEATKPSRCGWKTILWGVTLGVLVWVLPPCVLIGAVWLDDGSIGWSHAKMLYNILVWIALVLGVTAICWYLKTHRPRRVGCMVAGLSIGLVVTPVLAWVALAMSLLSGGGMTGVW